MELGVTGPAGRWRSQAGAVLRDGQHAWLVAARMPGNQAREGRWCDQKGVHIVDTPGFDSGAIGERPKGSAQCADPWRRPAEAVSDHRKHLPPSSKPRSPEISGDVLPRC